MDRYGKSDARVALRWLLQQPMVSTIPLSSSPEHIREDSDVVDFELDEGEVRSVSGLQDGLPDDLADWLGL